MMEENSMFWFKYKFILIDLEGTEKFIFFLILLKFPKFLRCLC